MHTHGFPNMFVQSNTRSALTVNFPHAMDELAKHVAYIVDECSGNNFTVVEASKEAEDEWVEEIIGLARFNEEYQASCTPGYYNNEG